MTTGIAADPINQVKYTTGENPKATEGLCFYENNADVMR